MHMYSLLRLYTTRALTLVDVLISFGNTYYLLLIGKSLLPKASRGEFLNTGGNWFMNKTMDSLK